MDKSLNFKNYILDNIHGFIGLTDIENRIERLDIFQRLRRIKQLGLTNWIFPGAEHTRYTHSLGVMHIIDQMAMKLGFEDEERQILRLAGMLHDIGHYPLSHIGEYAYMSSPVDRDFFHDNSSKIKTSVQKLPDFNPLLSVQMVKSPKPFHHENIGVLVIKHSSKIRAIIEERFPEKGNEVVEDICDIITGHLERKPGLSAQVQLLHSELDADRIDYLLRDAASSGASYGNFELAALIKCLARKEHTPSGLQIVGVNSKGIGVADQFMISRFMAYSQIIYQKHVAILQLMGQEVINWVANSALKIFPKPIELLEWVKTHEENPYFQDFTDQVLLGLSSKLAENHCLGEERLKFVNKLDHFKALEQIGSAFEFVGKNRALITETVVNEPIYHNLTHGEYLRENNRVGVFSSATITEHIPKNEFVNFYNNHQKNNDEMIPLDDYLVQRLQHGIAYIPDNSEPELLVDQPNSMIKDFSLYTRVILREYSLPNGPID